MCKGIAICVWKDPVLPNGYRIRTEYGISSHEALGADDYCLRFELFFPGTLQWDNPDEAGLRELEKNGIIEKRQQAICNIPTIPADVYIAIWEHFKLYPPKWSMNQYQSPVPLNHARFEDRSNFGSYAEFGDNIKFGDNVNIGTYSKFGNCIHFGENAIIDDRAEFGMNSYFSNHAQIGHYARFGNKTRFRKYANVGCDAIFHDYASFGDFAEFGNYNKFGDYSKFGSGADFGDCTEFGTYAEIGENAKFGDNTKFDTYAYIGKGASFDGNIEARLEVGGAYVRVKYENGELIAL
jgi:acetyltransferase-like isoleucine patch superfamily enzyme